MSTDVNDSFTKQYEAEVHTAYQRMGSALRGTVRTVTGVVGESTTFQKVGKGTASTKSRHGLVPVMNATHTPVTCTLSDHYAGDYVDKLDELKIRHDERKVVAEAGAYALGRKTDELLVTALNTSTNSTSVNLSAIAASTFADQLARIGDRDVPFDGDLYGAVSMKVWAKMLQIDDFANADYVGTEGLVLPQGIRPKMWMGVWWFPFSGLTIASNIRKCHVYHKRAIGHAIGADVSVDIGWVTERAAHFINHYMSQGAVMIDTEGVDTLAVTENA